MSYKIIPTPNFKSQAMRLIKKFSSLKKELSDLGITLTQKPALGTPLGNDTFKVRLAVKSKGKGKSGGMRIITFMLIWQTNITSSFNRYQLLFMLPNKSQLYIIPSTSVFQSVSVVS